MPRVKETEAHLQQKLDEIDAARQVLKKKLQVMRMRAAAAKRKSFLKSIRRNEKEVIELIRSKAPEFFEKLTTAEPKKRRRAAKKAAKKAGRKRATA